MRISRGRALRSIKFCILLAWVAWAPIDPPLSLASPEIINPNRENIQKIVNAIYHAEGGRNAKKPFGILSTACANYRECRRVCHQTVRNAGIGYLRSKKDKHHHEDFISYLAKRYAPIGAENDPAGLNRHWVKNVRIAFRAQNKTNGRPIPVKRACKRKVVK